MPLQPPFPFLIACDTSLLPASPLLLAALPSFLALSEPFSLLVPTRPSSYPGQTCLFHNSLLLRLHFVLVDLAFADIQAALRRLDPLIAYPPSND